MIKSEFWTELMTVMFKKYGAVTTLFLATSIISVYAVWSYQNDRILTLEAETQRLRAANSQCEGFKISSQIWEKQYQECHLQLINCQSSK